MQTPPPTVTSRPVTALMRASTGATNWLRSRVKIATAAPSRQQQHAAANSKVYAKCACDDCNAAARPARRSRGSVKPARR